MSEEQQKEIHTHMDSLSRGSVNDTATAGTVAPSSHTPGPWVVNDERVYGGDCFASVTTRQGEIICELEGRDPYASREGDANARLIAAAPDLLACLRRMCGMYGAYSRRLAPLLAEDGGVVWTFERANSLACEAIAKAEGR